jgi:hypothetical protein
VTAQPECRPSGRSMPSRRHKQCDSTKESLTCGNVHCDGIDAGGGCRHNRRETPVTAAQSRRAEDAVTSRDGVGKPRRVEISSTSDGVAVRLPGELPTLTPRVARVLLGILVELTEVPVLDRPEEGVSDDR